MPGACEAWKEKAWAVGNAAKVSKGAAASSIKDTVRNLCRSSPWERKPRPADEDGEGWGHHCHRVPASRGVSAGLLGLPSASPLSLWVSWSHLMGCLLISCQSLVSLSISFSSCEILAHAHLCSSCACTGLLEEGVQDRGSFELSVCRVGAPCCGWFVPWRLSDPWQ